MIRFFFHSHIYVLINFQQIESIFKFLLFTIFNFNYNPTELKIMTKEFNLIHSLSHFKNLLNTYFIHFCIYNL